MKRIKIDENRRCPKCNRIESQIKAGYNPSGTQRCVCKICKHKYTLNGKTRAYPEEMRKQAIKAYYAGGSGRSVGQMFGMSKANVYNWLKKITKNREK